MIAAAWFVGGTFFGLVLAVVAVITALRSTPAERERERQIGSSDNSRCR